MLSTAQGKAPVVTSHLATAMYGMRLRFGAALCSGPTDDIIDKFAKSLDMEGSDIAALTSMSLDPSDPSRLRRPMVVRGYNWEDEFMAIVALLQDPTLGDNAGPINPKRWDGKSAWKLHLSVAYWTLVLLESVAVRGLTSADKEALHERKGIADTDNAVEELRAVATGNMCWAEYEATEAFPHMQDLVEIMMKVVIEIADMLCTTPALTDSCDVYSNWKENRARCLAVDGAGSMGRADLYTVWGNTFMPASSPRSLGPK